MVFSDLNTKQLSLLMECRDINEAGALLARFGYLLSDEQLEDIKLSYANKYTSGSNSDVLSIGQLEQVVGGTHVKVVDKREENSKFKIGKNRKDNTSHYESPFNVSCNINIKDGVVHLETQHPYRNKESEQIKASNEDMNSNTKPSAYTRDRDSGEHEEISNTKYEIPQNSSFEKNSRWHNAVEECFGHIVKKVRTTHNSLVIVTDAGNFVLNLPTLEKIGEALNATKTAIPSSNANSGRAITGNSTQQHKSNLKKTEDVAEGEIVADILPEEQHENNLNSGISNEGKDSAVGSCLHTPNLESVILRTYIHINNKAFDFENAHKAKENPQRNDRQADNVVDDSSTNKCINVDDCQVHFISDRQNNSSKLHDYKEAQSMSQRERECNDNKLQHFTFNVEEAEEIVQNAVKSKNIWGWIGYTSGGFITTIGCVAVVMKSVVKYISLLSVVGFLGHPLLPVVGLFGIVIGAVLLCTTIAKREEKEISMSTHILSESDVATYAEQPEQEENALEPLQEDDNSVVEEPVVEEPVVEEPVVEEPKKEEPVVEEPKKEEKKSEDDNSETDNSETDNSEYYNNVNNLDALNEANAAFGW